MQPSEETHPQQGLCNDLADGCLSLDAEPARNLGGEVDAGIGTSADPLPSNKRPRLSKEERKRGRRERKKLLERGRRKRVKERDDRFLQSLPNDEAREEEINQRKRAHVDRIQHMKDSISQGVRVCIDLNYDDEHSERERTSLVTQLCYGYNVLKTSTAQISLHFTSYRGGLADAIRSGGGEAWMLTRHEEDVWDVFKREDIVYLSPDATDVLESFDQEKVYVIGGIVDRCVRKGRTLNAASLNRVACARLPIQEYIPKRVTHVLNVDTIIKIIAKYLETRDWLTTLTNAVPQRKQGCPPAKPEPKPTEPAETGQKPLDAQPPT